MQRSVYVNDPLMARYWLLVLSTCYWRRSSEAEKTVFWQPIQKRTLTAISATINTPKGQSISGILVVEIIGVERKLI